MVGGTRIPVQDSGTHQPAGASKHPARPGVESSNGFFPFMQVSSPLRLTDLSGGVDKRKVLESEDQQDLATYLCPLPLPQPVPLVGLG